MLERNTTPHTALFKPANLPSSQNSLHSTAIKHMLDFDWNNADTLQSISVADAQFVRDEIERSYKLKDSETDQQNHDLGLLCQRFGEYNLHKNRKPDEALTTLNYANELLANENKATCYMHLGFAHQQLLATANRQHDEKNAAVHATQALEFCQLVTRHYPPVINEYKATAEQKSNIRTWAFAQCVTALTQYERKELHQAINSYELACEQYRQIGDSHTLQYMRAYNRLGCFYTVANHLAEAKQVFEALDVHWVSQPDRMSNPFTARFFEAYGDYALAAKQTPLAIEQYLNAQNVLITTEESGINSRFVKIVTDKLAPLFPLIHEEKYVLGLMGQRPTFLMFSYCNQVEQEKTVAVAPAVSNRL